MLLCLRLMSTELNLKVTMGGGDGGGGDGGEWQQALAVMVLVLAVRVRLMLSQGSSQGWLSPKPQPSPLQAGWQDQAAGSPGGKCKARRAKGVSGAASRSVSQPCGFPLPSVG